VRDALLVHNHLLLLLLLVMVIVEVGGAWCRGGGTPTLGP
jgi:hypothetical protein